MRNIQTEPRSRCCAVCSSFDAEHAPDVRLVAATLKGTGNANAVFGTTQAGLVVRCPLKGRSVARAERGGEEHERLLASLEFRVWSGKSLVFTGDSAEDQLRYRSCIVAPFIGVQYLPMAMRLDAGAFRVAAQPESLQGRVDTDAAILMVDGTLLAGLSREGVVCIEMKPKFGGVVRCDTVPGRYRLLKRSVSRYQLHQSLKLEQGLIGRRSAYDPLDLFSNDPNRMRKALEALMDSPQNNLAVFLRGIRVPCEETAGGLDQACELLGLVDHAHLAVVLQGVLAWEGVLNDILRMQTVCEHDVQAVEALLREMVGADPRRAETPGSRGSRGAADDDDNDDDDDDGDDGRNLGAFLDMMTSADDSAALDLLADYCIATTAKDCSILVSMALAKSKPVASLDSPDTAAPGQMNIKQGSRPCELGSFGGISYRVTVVDLDRKSLRKLEGHKRLDDEILGANVGLLHSFNS